MYKCNVCQDLFYSTVDCASHLADRHPDQEQGACVLVHYRCERCGQVYGHRTDVKNHALRDHGLQIPTYTELEAALESGD